MTALSLLGRWVSDCGDDHPAEAYAAARAAVIDTVGCMLAGSAEDISARFRTAVHRWGTGACRAVGGIRAPAPFAALVNGTAAHALDFDDNDTPAASHPSAVLVPALLAIAEERRLGGRTVLDAYIVALEVMSRIGEAINMGHYTRGWHATATIGSLGAAAGCARLLKLTPAQTAAAISLATSRAAGFKSQFGTMAKPAHAGLAAETGVVTASLAAAGITASDETLDGTWSVLSLLAGRDAAGFDGLAKRLGRPLGILQYGLSMKRYPCCYYIARSLDGALELRKEHELVADDVQSVDITMPARNAAILRFPDPQTVAEARFSVQYCVAAALVHGRVGLGELSEAALRCTDTRALLRRVSLIPYDTDPASADLSPDEPDTITIRLKSGRTLSRVVPVIRGSAARPFSEDELFQKFQDCAARALDERSAEALAARLRGFEAVADVQEITGFFA